MFKLSSKHKKYIRILFVFLLLCSFYQLGVSWPGLLILGAVFLTLALLKDPIKQNSNKLVNEKLLFLDKLPNWLRKVIVFLIFLLIFIILKQAIFFGLKLMGIDLREMILRSTGQI